jgi:hypothetical protein
MDHHQRRRSDAIEMKEQTRPLAGAVNELLHPAYWLVIGLDWSVDGPMAEAAVAVAPGMIPRSALSPDSFQVLGWADLYATRHGRRVIFVSELTRVLAQAGTSWSRLGVDWQSALRQLHGGSFPAMFLTISERMYLHICDASDRGLMITGGESPDAIDNECELARGAITRHLDSDWPAYMQKLIDRGRIGFAR